MLLSANKITNRRSIWLQSQTMRSSLRGRTLRFNASTTPLIWITHLTCTWKICGRQISRLTYERSKCRQSSLSQLKTIRPPSTTLCNLKRSKPRNLWSKSENRAHIEHQNYRKSLRDLSWKNKVALRKIWLSITGSLRPKPSPGDFLSAKVRFLSLASKRRLPTRQSSLTRGSRRPRWNSKRSLLFHVSQSWSSNAQLLVLEPIIVTYPSVEVKFTQLSIKQMISS